MLAIEQNPDRWRQVQCELVPGDPWDFRVDTISFPNRNDADYATKFLTLILNIIKYAGGSIPLIVENNMTDKLAITGSKS